ncbi:hypothetical protein BRADI_5g20252v3 [Brachypodium distachyon]|uniref:Protein kinase domain-containing protein n=1 Tax=Brachypodium distachyon TaxID=15368 RepID=A0A0Q3E8Y1_BRADI|nr:hypothetical protein BRADI_5g20252v3 [Brachypodium distachyon]
MCTDRCDNIKYAIKIIKIAAHQAEKELREVTIFSSLQNHRIVKFYQAWVESNICVNYEECSSSSSYSEESSMDSKYILIQMELCASKSIIFDADKSLRFFEEIVLGLKYIHDACVIHRDIKPGNIFMGQDNSIMIGDFGQSCLCPSNFSPINGTPDQGTPFYTAPELLANKSISVKVDIYSLELFNTFKTASEKIDKFESYQKTEGSEFDGKWSISLFKLMTADDPQQRPSVDDILVL